MTARTGGVERFMPVRCRFVAATAIRIGPYCRAGGPQTDLGPDATGAAGDRRLLGFPGGGMRSLYTRTSPLSSLENDHCSPELRRHPLDTLRPISKDRGV